ncbi:hypothetical protein E3E12_02270 [Formicincola oecophyllae]|uniref:Pectate lyase superfamily protein domain-containing protein n=1 Tax=Formicincola oecophyllae TaxID=2558361 RepID=A0A4Y6U9V4_9PROT|nr:hypothetical protein [Formicincola oecophyllae]QDH13217.1 hypothetical protein E3E12_02270 [Formicincola oecophyllae]
MTGPFSVTLDTSILQSAPDGTADAPGFAFAQATNTGLYRNQDGNAVLTTQGQDVLVLDPEGLDFDLKDAPLLPSPLSLGQALSGVDVTPQMFDAENAIANHKPCDAAIERALAYLARTGGGILKFPRGFYYLDKSINITTSNIWLVGVGHGSTVLNFQASSNAMNGVRFTVNSEGQTQYRGGCLDMALVCKGTAQASDAGTFGLCTDATDDLLFRCLTISGFANGVGIMNTANTVRVQDIDVSDVANDAFYVNSPTSQYLVGCTGYQNFTPTGAGFHIQRTGGFMMTDCVSGGYISGCLIDPPEGATVQDGQILNCNFDDSQSVNINVDTTHGGYAINLDFTNARTGWSGKYGVAINGANTTGVKFLGGSASRCLQHGVLIEGGNNIEFHGFHSRGNGAENPGLYDGFALTGGESIVIVGGMAGPYAPRNSSETYGLSQQYGLVASSTFTGALRVVGTNLQGNLAGPVLLDAPQADISFTQCIGYTPAH